MDLPTLEASPTLYLLTSKVICNIQFLLSKFALSFDTCLVPSMLFHLDLMRPDGCHIQCQCWWQLQVPVECYISQPYYLKIQVERVCQ